MKAANNLFHLAYVSRRTPGVTDEDVIDDIVLPAMVKNRRLNVTGCLWFSPEAFLQVLEGEEATVRMLYEHIKEDRRHDDVHVFSTANIAHRNFQQFRMRVISDETPESIQELIEEITRHRSRPSQPIRDLELLVSRVIADLATWPMGSQGGSGTRLA